MALKAAGHSDPMSYTPRTLFAWYRADIQRQQRALAHEAMAIRAAHHAEARQFDRVINVLSS